MSKGFFITGTGTDVGKTYVTAQIVKALRDRGCNAGYYKAVLSGAELVGNVLIPGDAKFVCDTAKLPVLPQALVSYVYQTAVSPHLAARIEGNPPMLERMKQHLKQLRTCFDFICAEGAGGIVCPIRDDEENQMMQTDLMRAFDFPLLIVADTELGSINRAVLTVFYAQSQGLKIRGIILNRYDRKSVMHQENRIQIEKLTSVPVVGVIYKNQTNLEIIDITLFDE